MTTDDYLALLLSPSIEGGYVDDPADRGGPTNWGITAAEWGRFKQFGRSATAAEVQGIARDEARAYYLWQFALSPFAVIAYEPLRLALYDFGVNSGSARAIRWLQRTLGVPVNEGTLDDRTLRAVQAVSGRVLTNALVAARIRMVRDLATMDKTQQRFLEGWERRALRFALLEPVSM